MEMYQCNSNESTKVQNPRRISRIKPICAIIGDDPRCSSTPGQFSLLCGLAASVCLVRDKAKSATPSLQNNPPRCVERTSCRWRTWITLVVMRRIMIAHGPLGGWVTKLYACALFIIDGLGHEKGPRRCRFLDPERRLFSEIATLFFERLLR